MKKLSLAIDLTDIKLSDEEKKKTPAGVMIMVVDAMFNSYVNMKQGIREDERRKYYKVMDALEKADKDSKVEVELEDDLFGFLKAVKRETPMRPVPIMRRVEELIDAVNER